MKTSGPAPIARARQAAIVHGRRAMAQADDTLTATPVRAIRVHVLLVALLALNFMAALQAMRTWHEIVGSIPTHLQWPIAWAQWLPWRPVVIWLAIGGAVAAGVGLIGYRFRWARLLAFTGLLFWVSALNSFGKIGHAYHHLLLAMGVLAFMPSLARLGRPDARTRAHLAMVLTAQAVVLLTYSLSGYWKLIEGVQAVRQNRPSVFTDLSLPALINRQVSAVGGEPPLAWLVLDRPVLASVLYVLTMFVELFALATLATPRVAAVGALVLATFHLAVIWTMDISFIFSIGAVVILFLLSPMLERTGGDPSLLDPALSGH